MYSDVAVIIPARIGSSRLPRKLLEKINQRTVIEHVLSSIGFLKLDNLFVATDDTEIANIVISNGLSAIMTSKDCPTGSDRVLEAFKKIPNADKIKFVINIQGDMPFIDPNIVEKIIFQLKASGADIVTPVVKVDKEIAASASNVKVVADKNGRALYFSRSIIPYGAEEFLYHVGVYGFTVDALEKFVALEKGDHEKAESLEQLRALENGMNIGIFECSEIPISIDTAEDLAKAKEYYANHLKESIVV